MGTLVRLDSKAAVSVPEAVRSTTRSFDVETVLQLSLRSKGLLSIPILTCCISLADLDLSGNAISRIDGLEGLPSLTRLNLSANRLTRIEGLAPHLSRLRHLQLQDNQLARVRDLDLAGQLAQLPALRTLCLQDVFCDTAPGNACCEESDYKAAVLRALPQLTSLDGERRPHELTYAEASRQMRLAAKYPLVPHQFPVPDVAPWLAAEVLQGLQDSQAPEVEQAADELEAVSKALVRSLDKTHMLLEVLASELVNTRDQLARQDPAG